METGISNIPFFSLSLSFSPSWLPCKWRRSGTIILLFPHLSLEESTKILWSLCSLCIFALRRKLVLHSVVFLSPPTHFKVVKTGLLESPTPSYVYSNHHLIRIEIIPSVWNILFHSSLPNIFKFLWLAVLFSLMHYAYKYVYIYTQIQCKFELICD